MRVSLLSQDEFAQKVTQLNWRVRKAEFGTEVSLWSEGKLYALGFGKVEHVKRDLSGQFPTVKKYGIEEGWVDCPEEVALVGTPFQHKVWKELLEIPKGQQATYQSIAEKLHNPKAVRAVGSAIGKNPISLYVPCHRVIRQDGQMGGYRWGMDIKEKILNWEVNQ